jgi:hypothetical protein
MVKRLYLSTRLHGAIFQKTAIFIVNVMEMLNRMQSFLYKVQWRVSFGLNQKELKGNNSPPSIGEYNLLSLNLNGVAFCWAPFKIYNFYFKYFLIIVNT